MEYDKEPHVTDIYLQRDAARTLKAPADPIEALFTPPKARGSAERALAAAAVRLTGEYYVPIEHHNPIQPYARRIRGLIRRQRPRVQLAE